MTDITKCTNEKCDARWNCYRFTAPTDWFAQSYAEFEVPEGKTKCDKFEDNQGKKRCISTTKEYQKIVELRDHHLAKSNDEADFHFVVAHGLTEAIRVMSGVVTVTILDREK